MKRTHRYMFKTFDLMLKRLFLKPVRVSVDRIKPIAALSASMLVWLFINLFPKRTFLISTAVSILLNCVLYVLMCQSALRAYVLTCKRILLAHMLTYERVVRAIVPCVCTCSRAKVPSMLTFSRANLPRVFPY